MKTIISYPNRRFRHRFTCHWCGCVFEADAGDYNMREDHQIWDEEHQCWQPLFEYQSECPICGDRYWYKDEDVQIWVYEQVSDYDEEGQRLL